MDYFVPKHLLSITLFLLLNINSVLSSDYQKIQTLLLNIPENREIQLPPGIFSIHRNLSLLANDIVLTGSGDYETILSFKRQKTAGEGLLVKGNNITIKNLVILDTQGDGLKVRNSQNVVIDDIKVGWTRGAKASNGDYAIYPVSSKQVTIKNCETFAAAEAGLYIGQTFDGKIINNTSYQNVVGIEVENSQNTYIANNTVFNNSIGIMISDIPGLTMMGKHTKIENNTLQNNNLNNFSINKSHLGYKQQGIGILLVAVKFADIVKNHFSNHATTHVGVIHYLSTPFPRSRMTYNPNPFAITIRNNQFAIKEKVTTETRDFFQWSVASHHYDLLWDHKITVDDGAPALSSEQVICFDSKPIRIAKVASTDLLQPLTDKLHLLCPSQ
ncbi:MAG: parallel beta-helix domain-containing protein [Pseudomonadota bacterium]